MALHGKKLYCCQSVFTYPVLLYTPPSRSGTTSAIAARNYLTGTKDWIITDGELA